MNVFLKTQVAAQKKTEQQLRNVGLINEMSGKGVSSWAWGLPDVDMTYSGNLRK